MLALAAAMGELTFRIEHRFGASGSEFELGFAERLLVSGRSFWFYLGKLAVPSCLTFIYERWPIDPRAAWQYLYPVLTLGTLVGTWRLRGRIGAGWFVALAHFYICTSLLIFLVALYRTRYSFVSDHWQYFGCMSILALAAAGISKGFGRWAEWLASPGAERRTWWALPKPILCGLLFLLLGSLTWQQCRMYSPARKRSGEPLWHKTLVARWPISIWAISSCARESWTTLSVISKRR